MKQTLLIVAVLALLSAGSLYAATPSVPGADTGLQAGEMTISQDVVPAATSENCGASTVTDVLGVTPVFQTSERECPSSCDASWQCPNVVCCDGYGTAVCEFNECICVS